MQTIALTYTEVLIENCWEQANEHDIFSLDMLQLAPILGLMPTLCLNLFPSSSHLIEGMIEHIHRQAMKNSAEMGSISPEEKVFELTMSHFDVLSPYKRAADRLMYHILSTPSLGLSLKSIALKISTSILEKAGYATGAFKDQPRVIGYCFLGLSLFPTWLQDSSPDQSAVLRLLDERLKWSHKIVSFFPFP